MVVVVVGPTGCTSPKNKSSSDVEALIEDSDAIVLSHGIIGNHHICTDPDGSDTLLLRN